VNVGGKAELGRLSGEGRAMKLTCAFEVLVFVQAEEGAPLKACWGGWGPTSKRVCVSG